MNYYNNILYIDDIDAKIKQKENELLMLRFMNVDNIIHNTSMRNLEAEINELNVQRTYLSNMMADQLMQGCIGCSGGNCCRRKNVFY